MPDPREARDLFLHELFQRRNAVRDLAAALGISTAAVAQWRRVPAHRVAQVAAFFGVSKTKLRPDLYPPRKRIQRPAEPTQAVA